MYYLHMHVYNAAYCVHFENISADPLPPLIEIGFIDMELKVDNDNVIIFIDII